jgi:hypothetical protein
MSERTNCAVATHSLWKLTLVLVESRIDRSTYPKKRVHAGWLLAEEVPCRIVSHRRLKNLAIRLRFNCMYKVWGFNCVLYKEDRDVAANDIEVAFICIESHSKPVYVPVKVEG